MQKVCLMSFGSAVSNNVNTKQALHYVNTCLLYTSTDVPRDGLWSFHQHFSPFYTVIIEYVIQGAQAPGIGLHIANGRLHRKK